jgi:ABC-type transporter Mla MlaB component
MLEKVAPGYYRLHGKLTMQVGAQDINELLALTKNINKLDLDVSTLETADTVLLATIISVARSIEAHHGILCITGLSSGIRGLARVYGVDSLIDQYCLLP